MSYNPADDRNKLKELLVATMHYEDIPIRWVRCLAERILVQDARLNLIKEALNSYDSEYMNRDELDVAETNELESLRSMREEINNTLRLTEQALKTTELQTLEWQKNIVIHALNAIDKVVNPDE